VFAKFRDNKKGDDKKAIEEIKDILRKAVESSVGRPIEFITGQDEARYEALACIPPSERASNVLFDVGGGNTKGGYFNEDGLFYGFQINLGSKTFFKASQQEAGKSGKPFAEAASSIRAKKLEPAIREETGRYPALVQHPKVYLVGGITWAMTVLTHPADRRQRVKLTAADIDRFAVLVKENKPLPLRRKVLAQVSDDKARAAVEKDVKKIQEEVFPKQDQLIAGAEILKALSAELNLKDREIIFFRDAHIAWPMGYLMKKGNIMP
jgi:exopolyphosphatase/pppGpp-phosphohydrolase